MDDRISPGQQLWDFLVELYPYSTSTEENNIDNSLFFVSKIDRDLMAEGFFLNYCIIAVSTI